MRMNRMRQVLVAGLVLATATAAVAGVSPVIFRIQATNANGTATFSVPATALVPDPGTGGQRWALGGPVTLASGSNVIATLNMANVRLVDNRLNIPRVIVNFEIANGDLDATFAVESAVVDFLPIPAALSEGRATAGFTLTDFNDGVPASLQGPGGGAGIFTGFYNGSTVFANLIAGLSVNNGGTVTGTGKVPAVGTWQDIPVAVTDISLRNDFTLTARDSMSAQTQILVTPEPAALALVACGLLLARRR